jgi:hypothetical protein
MPRLSRTASGGTMQTVTSTRPQTAGPTTSVHGAATLRNETPNQTYTQPRRVVSSHEATFAGDRRSKPSQFLDDLLGGR